MSRRELIVASAGSGKTFQVSSRIIALLATGTESRAIFASTFTRKAAGEILDRVLLRMARAATGEPAELAGQLELDLAEVEGDPHSAEFWRTCLAGTVRELHRLDIGTLDAFFGRALGSFGYDLGLPPGWGIADEPTLDRVRDDALDGVLTRSDRAALIEVLRALHAGDVRRSVHAALAREADALLRVEESLAEGEPSGDAPRWEAMRRAIGARPDDLPELCENLADRIVAEPAPLTQSDSPDQRWVKAIAKVADVVRTRDWDAFLSGGLYARVLEAEPGEPPDYYGKLFPGDLLELLEDAAALARLDLGASLAARAEAMGRLAADFREAWQARLLATGRLRFEDVTRLLIGAEGVGRRDELMYRFDGGMRHVLLDEYQDTSLLQWDALRPALDAILGFAEENGGLAGENGNSGEPTGRSGASAGGGTVPRGGATVVADPKQSIYGWRGAAPVVVDAVGARYGLEPTPLYESWRSSQVVLDVVNDVFAEIHSADVVSEHPDDTLIARRWGDAFQPHVEAAAGPGAPRPGFVTLEVGPQKFDRRRLHPEMCAHAAGRVAELVARHPGRSIGVLTRTNDTVAWIMHELGRLGVPASEEGGGVITDSGAVSSVLALLRMIDHPGHGLARYHAGRTPVGPAAGFDRAVGLDPEGDLTAALKVSHEMREALLRDGYGATLRDLYERIRAHCDGRDHVRMRQLVELGHAWDRSPDGGLRVDDFVRLARVTRAESPGNERVRVMTIHGSKGLEFDVVVLPELHVSMFGGGDHVPIAFRPDGHLGATHAFPPMSSAVAELFRDVPRLQDARRQHRAGSVRDALGALYVAMTRARYALHLLVPADGGKPSSARSPARLLRERLVPGGMKTAAEEGSVLFESGDPDWSERASPPTRPHLSTPASVRGRIALRAGPRTRMLERLTPSSEEGGDRVDLALRLGLAGSGGRSRGTLVHAILETLVWLDPDDVAGSVAAVDTVVRRARRETPELSESDVRRIHDDLLRQLEAPEVRAALTRPTLTHSEGVSNALAISVENEVPFLMRAGDSIVEGVIDRLVLVQREGRVVEAEILDYKTDAVDGRDSEALAERVRYYAPQIRRYREAVADLHDVDPARIRGRLVFLSAGVVVELDLDAGAADAPAPDFQPDTR